MKPEQMLPRTRWLFEHPRVQARPDIAAMVATLADLNRVAEMSPEQFSFCVGILCGFLADTIEELDACDGRGPLS